MMIRKWNMDNLPVTLLKVFFEGFRIGYSCYKHYATTFRFWIYSLWVVIWRIKDSYRRFISECSKKEILIRWFVNFFYDQSSLNRWDVFRRFGDQYHISSSHIPLAFSQIPERHHMISYKKSFKVRKKNREAGCYSSMLKTVVKNNHFSFRIFLKNLFYAMNTVSVNSNKYIGEIVEYLDGLITNIADQGRCWGNSKVAGLSFVTPAQCRNLKILAEQCC